MKAHGSLGVALILVTVGACSTYGRGPAGEVSQAQVGETGRWLAGISPPPAQAATLAINGWAAMVPDSARAGTVVTLSLSDVPAATKPHWSVNRGKCGADEGVFGPPEAYAPLVPDGHGRATASARIPLQTPATGDYFVSVRAPSAGAEVTLACGKFAPPEK